MIAHSHHQAARLVWHFQPLTTLNQLFPGRGTQGLLVDMGLPVEHVPPSRHGVPMEHGPPSGHDLPVDMGLLVDMDLPVEHESPSGHVPTSGT